MLPQIFPDGTHGLTVFSGVFQYAANIPFTTSVDIKKDKHTTNTGFSQLLSHYHSARLVLHSGKQKRTENIFFGGISQFEEADGVLTKNDDVPFTKVISKIVRDRDGKLTETKLSEMPGYFGAGAELFLNPEIPTYTDGIVKLDELKSDKVMLGHIVGGIESTGKSVFFRNTGAQSSASKTVFRVWLTQTKGK